MVYAHQILLKIGLATPSATSGLLSLDIKPILFTLLGYFLFGEKQIKHILVGIAVGLSGAAIVLLCVGRGYFLELAVTWHWLLRS